MRTTLMIATALLAGCAATAQQRASAEEKARTGEAKLAELLRGRTAGEPQSCLPSTPTRSSTIVDGTAVVYAWSGKVSYVNRMGGACTSLDRDDIMLTRSPTGRPCRGDIVQLFDRGSRIPGPSCVFGDFVPYRKP